LKQLGVTTVEDIATGPPNILFEQASSSPSAYYIAIRGQTSDESILTQDSPVGVYIDGVYVPRTTGLKAA
jgi:iron complex outermembrane recepter protein